MAFFFKGKGVGDLYKTVSCGLWPGGSFPEAPGLKAQLCPLLPPALTAPCGSPPRFPALIPMVLGSSNCQRLSLRVT